MGKTVGIFCAGQAGDCLTISSVLKYREQLWDDCNIVWYIADENRDLLKYQDIELRTFPRGFGYPEMVEFENKILTDLGREPIWQDWLPLVDENNHMNSELKNNYPLLADIDIGYFPAPHQVSVANRHGIEYPNVSKKVFKIPDHFEWHPVLNFSEEEKQNAKKFMDELPEGRVIAIESFAGSSQSKIDGIQISDAMNICRQELGKCNFIFMSHKYLNGNESFPEGWVNNVDVFSASDFTVRQCALIVEKCYLLISVSSGISVAASAWGLNPTPIIQYCGSGICSTKALALGRFELVTTDGKRLSDAVLEFNEVLKKLLTEIK